MNLTTIIKTKRPEKLRVIKLYLFLKPDYDIKRGFYKKTSCQFHPQEVQK